MALIKRVCASIKVQHPLSTYMDKVCLPFSGRLLQVHSPCQSTSGVLPCVSAWPQVRRRLRRMRGRPPMRPTARVCVVRVRPVKG